jgi:hypothetical protein
MENITLSVSPKVVALGQDNPRNRQITICGDQLEKRSASKKRPHMVSFETSQGTVTLIQRDTHALWATHQTQDTLESFEAIYDKLAESGGIATVEAEFEPIGTSGHRGGKVTL